MADTGLLALGGRVARRLQRARTSINHIDVIVHPVADRGGADGRAADTTVDRSTVSMATAQAIEQARNRLLDRTAGSTDRRFLAEAVPTVDVVPPGADLAALSRNRRTLRVVVTDGCGPTPDAFGDLVDVFNNRPDLVMAYGDGSQDPAHRPETIERAAVEGPWLLPGFSPERLADQYYLGGLVAFRADGAAPAVADPIELIRSSVEATTPVAHLPWPLSQPGVGWSVAAFGSRRAGHREHVATTWPKASIIVPTRGSSRDLERGPTVLVEQAIASVLARSTYPHIELVVVTTPGTPDDLAERLERLVAETVGPGRRGDSGSPDLPPVELVVVHDDRPFNFSNVCNRGAVTASGGLLVFLNDDTEVMDGDWLQQLAGHAVRPDIGAVGGKLFHEDGTVQHCGIWTRGGHPVHRYVGWDGDSAGYLDSLVVAQNCLAVTGACLAVERSKFNNVGGFSPVFPNSYNDVDLCLKLLERGWRTVVEPRARLHHFEASTRDPSITDDDLIALHDRWRYRINHDPFDNPNHRAEGSEEWPLPSPSADGSAAERPPIRFWPIEPMLPPDAGAWAAPPAD